MARDITCDLCKEEPAIALYSTMADGTTLAIGENCAPSFAYGLAVATGVLPDPSVESEQVVGTVEELPTDLGEPEPAPLSRRTRKGRETPVEG